MISPEKIIELSDESKLTYDGGKSGYVDGFILNEYLIVFSKKIFKIAQEECMAACDAQENGDSQSGYDSGVAACMSAIDRLSEAGKIKKWGEA